MSSSILVSVVIPTHNRAGKVLNAVNSVLNQTHTNLEVIIIADGCTDATIEVLKSLSDSRIKHVIETPGVGGGAARNFGLTRATGDYVAFLDDDDEWMPQKTTVQLSLLQKYPNTKLVSCSYQEVSETSSRSISCLEVITVEDLKYRNYPGSFSFCMMPRSISMNLSINPELRACQDWDMWMKVLLSAPKGICRGVKESLVQYNIHEASRLSTSSSGRISARYQFLRSYWDELSASQRDFQLYELLKLKRSEYFSQLSYLTKVRMYFKALRHYQKSGYDQQFRRYLSLGTKLLNLS